MARKSFGVFLQNTNNVTARKPLILGLAPQLWRPHPDATGRISSLPARVRDTAAMQGKRIEK
jgi:hypothetical protein